MISANLPVESRVLAGMICHPDILALCDEVDCDYFVDMRHTVVLFGIRRAQESGEVTEQSVVEAIREIALSKGTLEMAEKVSAQFIRGLIAKAPGGGRSTIRRDISQLKRDADFRRQMYAESDRRAKERMGR